MGFFSELHRSESALDALPRFSRSRPTPAAPSSLWQGSWFFARCSRPSLLGASPRAPPSSSSLLHLRSFFGSSFVSRLLPSSLSEPFEAGRTRSIAERVVVVINREQVHDKSKPKHDQYSLCCFGISSGRSCKTQVRRNLDHGSPSWTLRLEGPGWRASVLDCPDLSAGSLTGRKIDVSPESLNFCKTDAETATVAAHEVEHALASAEMLVQDLCLVIDRIQMVEQRRGTGFFGSIPPPEMEMIVQDHCLVTRPRMLPLHLVIALFRSLLAILSPAFITLQIPCIFPLSRIGGVVVTLATCD